MQNVWQKLDFLISCILHMLKLWIANTISLTEIIFHVIHMRNKEYVTHTVKKTEWKKYTRWICFIAYYGLFSASIFFNYTPSYNAHFSFDYFLLIFNWDRIRVVFLWNSVSSVWWFIFSRIDFSNSFKFASKSKFYFSS